MIPKFDVYHKELHSSYLSFEKYKIFLQSQLFNGYIIVEDGQTQFFIFIKEGRDIGSFMVYDHTVNIFDPSEINSLLKHPFFVSSYRSPQQVVDFFARCHTLHMLIDNLPFDSIEFDKFFSQIELKKITGFLEAAKGDEPKKYIYFYGGKIFGYMNIKGKDGVFEKNLEKNQIQSALSSSTVRLYSLGSVVVYPSKKQSTSPQPPAPQPDNAQYDDKRMAVIECYEEIFQMLERNTDTEEFTSIWRTSALELSNKYIFLNPFAGEFSYDNGKLDLWEKVDIKIAIQAMDELINSIAKKANLPKDGIRAIKDNYLNILVAYEIRS
ncbi:MAG: hypothetical protein HQK70_00655 [Desulfamplus sp.]|nr:hypothetical protein [Desulfamplus sp.]